MGVSETIPAVDGMVWIPGGTFMMGSDRHYPEEAPAHPATVGGFWIDSCPVTNAMLPRHTPAAHRHGPRPGGQHRPE